MPTHVPAWRRGLRLLAVPALVAGLAVGSAVATPAAAATTSGQVPSAGRATGVSAARLAFERSIISTAARYTGIRYVYGGSSPRTGFDCSGYVGYVFRVNHRALPRTAASIYGAVQHIARSQARPGDLVFFSSRGHVYHVGIYAGGGMLYHASRPGRPTAKAKIWSSSVLFGRVR